MLFEVRRVFQRRSANARRQTELGVVGDVQRFGIVFRADHARDRAEDFLAVDRHHWGRLGDERGLLIEAFGRTLEQLSAEDAAALLRRDADVLEVARELARIDDRADVGAGRERVVDLQRLDLVDDGSDKTIVNTGGDDHAARRRAALAGRKIRALNGSVHRHAQFGIVEHDERIFAAHLALHLGTTRGATRDDASAGRDRAGEADRVHLGRVDKGVADFRARPHHEVEYPFGKRSAADDLGDRP